MRVVRAEIAASAANAAGFPQPAGPEVAFLGRSNVGKSSLLNRLVQRKSLAKTSSTPGKTRLVNWFKVERSSGPALFFVDLPGYGFARVSRSERERWKALVEAYLGEREALRAAVLLQDLRRDWSEDESLLVDWLAERGVPVIVALTKADKLKPMRRAARVRDLAVQIGDVPRERLVPTSAEKGFGIPELWRALDALL